MSIIKLLHVFLIFTWIGSLISLTRIIQCADSENGLKNLLFKKVYMCVELPSMLGAIVLGFVLVCWNGINFKAGWFHMKMTFAIALVFCDLLLLRTFLTKKSLKRGIYILQTSVVLFLFAVLFSIYVMKPLNAWQKKNTNPIVSSNYLESKT